ncbi:unnamed protein product [Brassica rapa]|nr:unnamed protein product [Brassica napus]CAG7895534.1 unnamed protein product [Brassica rapa]
MSYSSFLSSAAFFTILLLLHHGFYHVSDGAQHATYIVHMAQSQMPLGFDLHSLWYDSSLRSVSQSAQLLYTYANAIHGFSTRLTPEEADSLMTLPGVILVLPEHRYELHTTRTPLFLGLDVHNADLFPETGSSSDVVVGVLDTGVWPESKSFSDVGLGPVTSTWRGGCEAVTNFTASLCNRKLIGARFFARGYEATMGPVDESKESRSPRDDDGHGTHTSFDILAAIDKAVDDIVDVLSMSLGGGTSDYYRDSVAIGAFAAMERGILVSCSAGNSGPSSSTLSNVAPWITTVGVGTIDRDFPAVAVLGKGKNYSGISLFKGDALPDKTLPFVYAGNATNAANGNLCGPGTLIPEKVKAKIVMCDRRVNARVQKGEVELVADAHLLPATTVGEKAGDIIRHYVLTDPNPTASVLIRRTVVNVQPCPVVAAFSSRGPNSITPDIIKPDLIAPGVNILAGWTGSKGPTGLASDARRVEFNIISGTSMSCPHVSGLAALLNSVHPEWSPAAIRSALMTTAYKTYNDGKPILDVTTGKPSTPFEHGVGHVLPTTAINPGLIFDLTTVDYLGFLCALNYTPSQITSVSRRNYTCDPSKSYSVAHLNYPSFAVNVDGSSVFKYTRTVTSVGGAGSYSVKVILETTDVKISVEPAVLNFKEINEKKSHSVTFTVNSSKASRSNSFGSIEWSDGKHVVASPVAISWT